MSVFTDDDLKRLKERIQCTCVGFKHAPMDVLDVDALLARLEAAEKVIAKHVFNSPDEPHWCLDEWRKSKGLATGSDNDQASGKE